MDRDPELPIDPDAEHEDDAPERPLHLRRSSVALVFTGGAVGTAARESVSLTLGALTSGPVAVLAVNVVGAFLLGVLLESLARRGADVGRRRMIRLALGTGFMGGFTTYSALATDTALLVRDGSAAYAVGYAIGTLVVGALATWAGIAFGARRVRRPA